MEFKSFGFLDCLVFRFSFFGGFLDVLILGP